MEGGWRGLLALVAYFVTSGSSSKEPIMAMETRKHAFSVFQERVAPYGALHRLCWKGYVQSRGRDGCVFAALQQYYEVRATQPLLALAGDMASSHPELRDYTDWLYRQADEERPHADWFRDELLALGFSEEALRTTIPEHEILTLLGAQFSLVVSVHPAALLGYLYTVAAHPAHVGAIEALAAKLDVSTVGLLRTPLCQAEVDEEHSAEVLGLVNRFVDDPLCFEAMLTSAALFLSGWSRLFRRKSLVTRGGCDG